MEARPTDLDIEAAEKMADDLYNRGYRDAIKERNQDARGCEEWQVVVDAIAPLATPADAGAGRTPTTGNKQVDGFLSEYEIRADSGVYALTAHDRWVIANFLIELDEEAPFLARMSTPGAQVMASDKLRTAIMNLPCKANDAWGVQKAIGYEEGHRDARHAAAELVNECAAESEAPAPVTAEPAQSIDTPEFRMHLANWRHSHARGSDEGAMYALVEHINKRLAPAQADRDAILNAAIEAAEGVHVGSDAEAWGRDRAVAAIEELKSMERAADAAETRDAKGGE